MVRIAINGFGRIGRNILRYLLENPISEIDCVAIYDLYNIENLAHLFEYDSILGIFKGEVSFSKNQLIVNEKKIEILKATRNQTHFEWKRLKVDIVIDCTGQFYNRESIIKHLDCGAKKVIVSRPTQGEDFNIIMGINHHLYNPEKHHIISNLSCTTNCLAPVLWVLDNEFIFVKGFMNTVHAYTNDQELLDHAHNDLRRSRAGGLSMIPTTTGATESIIKIFPHLKNKIKGSSIRIPLSSVSLIDFVFETKKAIDVSLINNLFKSYSQNQLKGILGYTDKPLVSIDFKKNSHSSVVDGLSTSVINENDGEAYMGRILAWYDNEWAYSVRIVDIIELINKKSKH